MRSVIATLAWALYAAAATATAALEPRQGTASLFEVQCGRSLYNKQQIDKAVAEGCRLHEAGEQAGRNGYPHRFNNYEALQFAASGPYQEFPVLASGSVFTGSRSPGPDRVIFNPDLNGACVYVGAITHTGASRGGFVPCVETLDTTATTTTTGRRPSKTTVSSSNSGTTTTTSTSTTEPNAAGRVVGGVGGTGAVVGVVAGWLLL